MLRIHLSASMVASIVLACSLIHPTSADAAPVLAVDFGEHEAAGPGNPVQSGFSAFTITNVDTPTTVSYGAIDVTVSDTGTPPIMDDRLRTGPSNSGSFTQSDLMRDLVFADGGDAPGQGLNILIEGLVPNAPYQVVVWGYDSNLSTFNANRISDWFANGVQVADDHNISGPAPTDNTQYSFTFTESADANGEMLLEGRQVTTTSAVLINGFQMTLVPEPSIIGLLSLSGLLALRRRS